MEEVGVFEPQTSVVTTLTCKVVKLARMRKNVPSPVEKHTYKLKKFKCTFTKKILHLSNFPICHFSSRRRVRTWWWKTPFW